ncbi:hypothetical protein B296_00011134 [Ensete ventricosum]|uniref:Uncharacterized protein n=1 Tax=Ensete ventricosum TaxID=4639 RepID=A0A427A627_ENSVE|nr:hypothetical protein B296_00011134 [Ensete ventricosum]
MAWLAPDHISNPRRRRCGFEAPASFPLKSRRLLLMADPILSLCLKYPSHMVIPGVVLAIDDGSSKALSWVDAGTGDGDGGQANQEYRKANGQGSKNLLHAHLLREHEVKPKQERRTGNGNLSGTWESLALLLASVAEKTV